MTKVVLIIQARMGSKRLPGKSMLDLAGEPLIGRILERVKKCKSFDDIILAIPSSSENKILRSIALNYGINIFEGSEDDLVERYFEAALNYKADFVARLPADNPTPEPFEIDKLVNFHLKNNSLGFSSNLSPFYSSGYPDGIGVEIFSFALLKEVFQNSKTSSKREHVHLNFFDYESETPVNNDWCPIKTLKCPNEYRRPDLILDVNTYDQYLFMKSLYENIYPMNNNFTIVDIIHWFDNKYKISKKNL